MWSDCLLTKLYCAGHCFETKWAMLTTKFAKRKQNNYVQICKVMYECAVSLSLEMNFVLFSNVLCVIIIIGKEFVHKKILQPFSFSLYI